MLSIEPIKNYLYERTVRVSPQDLEYELVRNLLMANGDYSTNRISLIQANKPIWKRLNALTLRNNGYSVDDLEYSLTRQILLYEEPIDLMDDDTIDLSYDNIDLTGEEPKTESKKRTHANIDLTGEPPGERKREPHIRPIGFENPYKSTCYFNSVIQALKVLDTFQLYMKTNHQKYFGLINTDKTCPYALLNEVKRSIGKSDYKRQEDAVEYLVNLIGYLDKNVKNEKNENKLERRMNYTYSRDNVVITYGWKEPIAIFNENDIQRIQSANDIIVIRLIRPNIIYSDDGKHIVFTDPTNFFGKYPTELIVNGVTYLLKATVERYYGRDDRSGHYTARVKSGDRFYEMDDMDVTEVNDLDILPTTLVLFYERIKSDSNSVIYIE